MIKINYLTYICVLLFCQCSAQKNSITWKITKVKTTYVQKGQNDEYELPKKLIGKEIYTKDSLLIITGLRSNYVGSNLSDEFGDTVVLKKKVCFEKIKAKEDATIYPSDEFLQCVQNDEDTCFASDLFFNLLGIPNSYIYAYTTETGKHTNSKLILFLSKQGKELILYSENDFLLLFLTKKSHKKKAKN